MTNEPKDVGVTSLKVRRYRHLAVIHTALQQETTSRDLSLLWQIGLVLILSGFVALGLSLRSVPASASTAAAPIVSPAFPPRVNVSKQIMAVDRIALQAAGGGEPVAIQHKIYGHSMAWFVTVKHGRALSQVVVDAKAHNVLSVTRTPL